MGEKLNDDQAINKAFDSLIKAYKDTIEEKIVEFNQQKIFRVYGKIQSKLENKFKLDIKIDELKPLDAIESEIESCEEKIKILKELRENM